MCKFYYKVKEGTPMYKDIIRIYEEPKKWFLPEVKKDIEALIGYDYGTKFVYSVSNLYVLPEKVKEEDRSMYLKGVECINGGCYLVAKQRSKVFKEYKEICKKHGLCKYDILDFSWDYCDGRGVALMPFNEGSTFILEFSKEFYSKYVDVIDEVTVLEMKLEEAKKNK